MCPGQVPGRRSETVTERSTIFEAESELGSKALLLELFEGTVGAEAEILGAGDYLGVRVGERLFHEVLET
jgi:hypothetical protein